MPKSGAERMRIMRERAALGLLKCDCWIPGKAFESYVGNPLSEAELDDPVALGEFVRLVFEAVDPETLNEMLHCNARRSRTPS